jgi:anaerobic nitric oxide reductase transcription regulator
VAQSAPTLPQTLNHPVGLKASTEQFQRQIIVQALEQAQGNWSAAAKVLEVDRANLVRLAKRLDIRVEKRIAL